MSATPARAAVKATPAAPGARARAPATKPAARRRLLTGRKVPASTGRTNMSKAVLGGKLLTMLTLVLSGSLLPPASLVQPGQRHSSFGHAAGQAGASTIRTREGPAVPRSASAVACPGTTVHAPLFGQAWQHGKLPRLPPAMAMAPRERGLGARPLAEPALPADRPGWEAPRPELPLGWPRHASSSPARPSGHRRRVGCSGGVARRGKPCDCRI